MSARVLRLLLGLLGLLTLTVGLASASADTSFHQLRAAAHAYDVHFVFAAETEPGLVEGANGALRDPSTGRFAPNPDRVAPVRTGVHGNSRLSEAETSLYQLYDFEGNYLKTGITSDRPGRYTQDFMSDKFMDIINVGSRSNMMDLERLIVEYDPGPLNFEPWAGAAR